MSIDRWMDKEDVVYICRGILLSLEKDWNLAICNNMDGPRGYYAKWSKSDTKRQIPYDFTYMWNIKKEQNKWLKRKQKPAYI